MIILMCVPMLNLSHTFEGILFSLSYNMNMVLKLLRNAIVFHSSSLPQRSSSSSVCSLGCLRVLTTLFRFTFLGNKCVFVQVRMLFLSWKAFVSEND